MKNNEFARDDIEEFDLYTRKNYERFSEFDEPVLLDHNENWFISLEWQRKILKKVVDSLDVRRYPRPYSPSLSVIVAELLKVEADMIAVGNGLDEVIDIITRAFVEKGDEVIAHIPSFGHYKTTTKLAGGKFVPILLKDNFDLDVEAMLAAVTKQTKIIFLCSPNNPTGNQFKKADVKKLTVESEKIVVIDEAYVNFARETVLDLLGKCSNLVVLRSFSKSVGLAGLRIGFSIADRELTDFMKKVQHPYNVGVFSQRAVEEFLKNWDYIAKKTEESNKEREQLFKKLSMIEGVKPYPSEANFLLTRFKDIDVKKVYEKLVDQGIFVKDLGNAPLCDNCLRIGIGTHKMNVRLLDALKSIIRS
ncbi:histidinol-phosphate transaminase [Candidatus Bathyarchaeota archaeon]|nr:histidinol-phosphate transaminase [Candidatus Bathyarchaeota archaeon]